MGKGQHPNDNSNKKIGTENPLVAVGQS